MKSIAVIVLLALAAVSASAQSKNVTVSTDRFTGFTRTTMKPFDVGPLHGFADATHVDGHAILTVELASGGGKTMLLVESTANHWQFEEGADVRVLADGKRIDLGHLAQVSRVIDHTKGAGVTVGEQITGYVEADTLRQVANAKEVEIKIGPYPAKLTAENIRCLKDFVEALPSK